MLKDISKVAFDMNINISEIVANALNKVLVNKGVEIEEQEKLREKELEQRRKTATDKGYILAQDYKGKLYDIQDIYNHPGELSWSEYEKIKNSVLDSYDTLQNLIKEYSLNISTAKFNRALKSLNFIEKDL